MAAYAVSELTRDTSSLFRRTSLESFGLAGWYQYFHLGWDERRFPIPVVLTGVDEVAVTAQDSVDLWRGIAWLHHRLGRVVFRPGTRTETPRIDVELDGSNRAFGGMVLGPNGEAVRGVYLASRPAIQMFGGFATIHELLHTVGFGHTCSWGSVMRSCGDSNFSPAIIWTEPWKDVAYFDLWHALGTLRRQGSFRTLTLHLGENVNGERREQGLPEERVFYGDPWQLNRN
jgi:hypothetical protein